jgi:uncharacterized membrane protein YoaT (DUF817 family)
MGYKVYNLIIFICMGFLIWIAENIATYFGAWKYPGQLEQWTIVGFGKIGSWFLLVIISIVIVANLKLGDGIKISFKTIKERSWNFVNVGMARILG